MFAKDLDYISILVVSSLVLRPKAKSGRLRTSNRSSRQSHGWNWDKGLVRISSFHRFKAIELLILTCVLPGLIIHLALSYSDSVFSYRAIIIWD